MVSATMIVKYKKIYSCASLLRGIFTNTHPAYVDAYTMAKVRE
jgi:hypothetical protein